MGQTVNLLSFDFGGSNPSAPTKKETLASLFYLFMSETNVNNMNNSDHEYKRIDLFNYNYYSYS